MTPLLGRLLLRLRRLGERREEIENDLQELYVERAANRGRRYAALRYCADVVSLWIHRPERIDQASRRLDRRLTAGERGAECQADDEIVTTGAQRTRWLDTIALDLRYAARMLRKQPLLTCAVVLTLSIGIAAPTSIFSLLNGFVFRTPASGDPEAFFRVVRADRGARGIATPPQYDAFRQESRSARELAAWSRMGMSAPLGHVDPTRVPGLLVSCNFLRVFGVDAPLAGRLLHPDDCAAALPVAVMSETLWRNRFAADPTVVGTTLAYGAVPVTIVGVAAMAPIQIEAHDPDGDYVTDLWFPYTAHPVLKETSEFGALFWRDDFPWLELAGVLAPGLSRRTAEIELRLIEARRQDTSDPAAEDAVILTDGSRWGGMQGDDAFEVFAMALIMPALIMLTACVNVAALLLSRAVSRQREMAVRLALGTSRAALVRMLLVESLLVSGLASLLSLVLVYRLPPLLVRFFEAELWFGAVDSVTPDGRVFAFLIASGVLAAVLSGVSPALESLNPHLAETLQGRRGFVARRGPSRTRRLFVGIQVAACMVLLVTAITFARTATRFTDPGFATEGLLVADLREAQNPDTALAAIAADVAPLAGVASVAYTELLPLVRERSLRIRMPDQPGEIHPMVASVSPDYFEVFEIPILAGRSFDRIDEGQGALEPIVVSRRFAERFFATENVLGEVIETGGRNGGERMLIIGIAGDRIAGRSGNYPALSDGSMIYRLMEPASVSGFLVVKTESDPVAMIDRLETLLRELSGSPTAVETFASRLAGEVVVVRRVQTLLLVMGGVALLLASVGVVATVSADANQRRREFAIRLALGAAPAAVQRRVVATGLRPVHAGVFFGLLLSWGAMRVVESLHVLPLASVAAEPRPYVVVTGLLLMTALATLLAVAYPISRRDPLTSLREE